MTALVPAEDIERIVGVKRHPTEHWGRAVSAEQRVYILHSQECLDDPVWGLQDCLFSLALDQGISLADWSEDEDAPVRLDIHSDHRRDWLVPVTGGSTPNPTEATGPNAASGEAS